MYGQKRKEKKSMINLIGGDQKKQRPADLWSSHMHGSRNKKIMKNYYL
jgi:hypothetical protein